MYTILRVQNIVDCIHHAQVRKWARLYTESTSHLWTDYADIAISVYVVVGTERGDSAALRDGYSGMVYASVGTLMIDTFSSYSPYQNVRLRPVSPQWYTHVRA